MCVYMYMYILGLHNVYVTCVIKRLFKFHIKFITCGGISMQFYILSSVRYCICVFHVP